MQPLPAAAHGVGGGTRHGPHLTTARYGGQLVDLDLVATLGSTGAARQFHPEPVPDEALARLLDTAPFAPSGGNRQGWRVIVVKDPAPRRRSATPTSQGGTSIWPSGRPAWCRGRP